jgi:outer membrane lipoprotein SlyB
MRPEIRTMVALLAVLTVADAAPTGAQPSAAPLHITTRGVVQGDVVEGRINRVDARTRTITLDNGQEYVVPSVVTPDWTLLQAGVPVMMRYNVDGGRNLVTYVEVRP